MLKKILLVTLLGLLILVGLWGFLWGWTYYNPRNATCIPISYPDGAMLDVESFEVYTFETNAAYSEVVDFYRTNLKFDPPLKTKYEDVIEWDEYPIRDVGILFECGSKLNSYQLELSCIFVRDENGKGVIDITWSYADNAAAPCYTLPGIEPEDYLQTP